MIDHTPGPWDVSKQKARRVTASGIVICNAVLRNRGGPKHKEQMKDEHEAEANACLIAAAPELLAALDALRDQMVGVDRWWGELSTAVEAADAALAKARGEA